jgi:hypothetical protein
MRDVRGGRRRRRGQVAVCFVLSMGLVLAAWLAAGAGSAGPLGREVRLEGVRDQALALADAGVEAARVDAARGAAASIPGLRVGDAGIVDVLVSRDGEELVVRATGRARAPALGPGVVVSRVVVARLRGGDVVAWEEVP